MLIRLLMAFGVAFLASCGSSDSEKENVVFHYNQHNNITSLDPAYAKSQNNIWAVHHIFSTLLQLDDSLQIKPGLAKSWYVDDLGLTYEFQLREDVMFHESPCFGALQRRKVTATDVVYSFERLVDTSLNAPGSWLFKGRIADEKPFVALNDSTFQLKLITPFAPLLSLLTMQYCSIVPSEAIEYFGSDFQRNPVGSGPFQFKKWLANQGLFLERNDSYYGWHNDSLSNLKGIRTSFIGERSLAFLELINGRIDFFSGLESSYINTALLPNGNLQPRHEKNVKLLKAPYLNFEYLGINPRASNAHPLLKDVNFRRALNYSVDRKLMLRSLRNNVGKPADAGVITRGLPAYNPEKVKGFSFDFKRAKELISSFNKETLAIPLIIQTSKDYLDLTTFIAKQWENLGLVVNIEVMESAALRNAMRNGDVGVFRASWIADYPDGESFLSMFYSQNPAPPNYTRFQNQAFDDLYNQGLLTNDIEEKINLYQSMDQILVEEAPVVFLFYDEVALFTQRRVKGIRLNALNLLHVDNIYIEE